MIFPLITRAICGTGALGFSVSVPNYFEVSV